jgi:hypothetical protein
MRPNGPLLADEVRLVVDFDHAHAGAVETKGDDAVHAKSSRLGSLDRSVALGQERR